MIKKTHKENKDDKRNPWFSNINLKSLASFVLVILLGLPLVSLTAFLLAFRGRVYPRVSICRIILAGKTQKEARTVLNNALKGNVPSKITLTYHNQNYTLNLNSLVYLTAVSSQKALRIGRGKPSLNNLRQWLAISRWEKDLPFDFRLNETRLDSQIASIAATLYLPAVEPEIRIIRNGDRKTILVEAGENGQEVDLRRLREQIDSSLACPEKEISLTIPMTTISPQISSAEIERTKNRAANLLNREIKIKFDDQEWRVMDEEIISFLSFREDFDRHKISEYVQNLAKLINTPPENAAFRFENNRVTVFRPSKEGISLKENEFIDDFQETLLTLENDRKNQEMNIPVTKTPAKISISDINSLGIQELLGRGTSLFFGSIAGRIHNINLASLRLNGILVGPGEVFSFNKTLGDVSANTGFKQAYIIKEGRTVLGDGGGVCQVSTTLFRAVLNSGLPILERHAHAYRVHYYEEDLGPGFDATVFDPTADLKFKNDTSAYILIQSSIDIKKKKLTFEIYGTNDSRKVEISKARVWNKVPPPPDLYQDDPTLPLGTINQVDWKAWGAKTAFDYQVTRNGEILTEKTFTSYYRPWQAVYLRGTGL